MRNLEALRLALYLFHLPSAVRAARNGPLPSGIDALLEVAADAPGAAEAAATRLERPVDTVRQACAFFIEQIMLAPEADAYRILGAARQATDGELRRHMALILRWVHPDAMRAGDRSVYAGRVTTAWEALKTQDRRAAYDAAHPPRSLEPGRRHTRRRPDADRRTPAIIPEAFALVTRPPVADATGSPAPARRQGLIVAALRRLFRRSGSA